MKAILKKIIRQAVNKFYQLKYNFIYSNKQQNTNLWDGSYEGLCDLACSLVYPIVNLSQVQKKTFVLPPSFQTSVHKFKIEKCETFARSFIGASYLLNARSKQISQDPKLQGICNYYRNGILEAMNPNSENYWGYNNHLLLENTSIITGLLVCQDTIWSTYSNDEKCIILDYLTMYACEPCYQNNWLWCKVIHLAFLEVYAETKYPKEIADLLLRINQMQVGGGWYTDGYKESGGLVDYYSAWSFHYYGLIFVKYFSKNYPEQSINLKKLSTDFFRYYQHFFTPGGTHPIFGRSQLYKFAALAPFGYILGNKLKAEGSYQHLKYSFVDEINVFLQKGGISSDGFISMGVTYPDTETLEDYSASGSVYWALKAFSLLLIEPEHDFWQQALPTNISKPSIITITSSVQMLMHDGVGSILLADFNAHHKIYKSKYNKLVFPNITYKQHDNIIFNIDNSIWFSHKGKKIHINEVVESKCEDGHGFLVWKVNELPGTYIRTDLIGMHQGYAFMHQVVTSSKVDDVQLILSGFGVREPSICQSVIPRKAISLICKNDHSLNSLLEIDYTSSNLECRTEFLHDKKGGVPIVSMNLADYFCIAGVCAKNISLDTQMIYQFSKSNGIYSVEFNDKLFNINKIENQYG